MMMNDEMNTEAHIYTLLTSDQWRTDQNGCSLHNGIFHPLITPPPLFFIFLFPPGKTSYRQEYTRHISTQVQENVSLLQE